MGFAEEPREDDHEDDHHHAASHDEDEDEDLESLILNADWHQVGSPVATKLLTLFELTARRLPLNSVPDVEERRRKVFSRIYSKGGVAKDEALDVLNEIKSLRQLLPVRKRRRGSSRVGEPGSREKIVTGHNAVPVPSVEPTSFDAPVGGSQSSSPSTTEFRPEITSRTTPPSDNVHVAESSRVPVVQSESVVRVSSSVAGSGTKEKHGIVEPTSVVSQEATGPLKTAVVDGPSSSDTVGREVPSLKVA